MYNPELDHRHSLRLQHYDYSQEGAYFVTVCTHNKRPLFGEDAEGKITLNKAGVAAKRCWLEIPIHFPHAEVDVFVVMPNHVHGIIVIGEAGTGANDYSPLRVDGGTRKPHGTSQSIGSIVRGFKIGVTKWFRENDGQIETIWQRNYYERVIRSEKELNAVREYILGNPTRTLW